MPRDAEVGADEIELLLACCRMDASPARVDRIGKWVRTGVNWEGVCELARENGVLPLLFAQLNAACAADVPAPQFERLRREIHALSLKHLRLAGELIRIAGRLKAEGIEALPFKGPALACLAYRNLNLRTFNDLDMILRREDFPRAKAVLLSEGYQVRPPFDETPFDALWKSEYNACNFDHPEKGIAVDVHWTVASDHFSIPFDLAPCWGRTVSVAVGGATLPTLGPEDCLLALCAHGYTHSWKKLSWICDLAELIRTADLLDWARLLALAKTCRAERVLFLGLRLASDLLAAELSEPVKSAVEADAVAGKLAGQVRGWLFRKSGGPRVAIQKRLLLITARECWRDRLQVARHLALTPNERDRAFLRLPPAWQSLLYVVRPVRLLVKFIAGVAR